jgi:predicted RecB family nuclease
MKNEMPQREKKYINFYVVNEEEICRILVELVDVYPLLKDNIRSHII